MKTPTRAVDDESVFSPGVPHRGMWVDGQADSCIPLRVSAGVAPRQLRPIDRCVVGDTRAGISSPESSHGKNVGRTRGGKHR